MCCVSLCVEATLVTVENAMEWLIGLLMQWSLTGISVKNLLGLNSGWMEDLEALVARFETVFAPLLVTPLRYSHR